MTDETLGGNAQSQLRSIVEHAENLEADKAAVTADLKEVFAEAKGNGFCVPIIKKVIRLRKQDRAKRQEEEVILDLYMNAIGEDNPQGRNG